MNDNVLDRLRYLKKKKQEHFVCISIGVSGEVLKKRTVFIGTLTCAVWHPREIFVGPIKDRAKSIIIAHNHPSGNPTPSDGNIASTQQIVAAGQILGIEVIDHFVISKNGHFSFLGSGLLIEQSLRSWRTEATSDMIGSQPKGRR